MNKEKITNHSEFLEQQPVFEGDNKEVFENADGSQYIPVGIIEELLDLFSYNCWNTTNFKFSEYENSGKHYVSGSIELTVSYSKFIRDRNCPSDMELGKWIPDSITRVGAATLSIEELKSVNAVLGEKENTSFEATILSLALCNAAKKLGNRFGRRLNGRGVGKVQDGENQEKQLRKADAKIIETYKKAVEDNDLEKQAQLLKVYDIKISQDAS